MPGLFTIQFFEDDRGRSPVEKWMDGDLSDLELAALLSAFEHVLSHQGLNVCGSEWGKQLGEGLFEFRVRHTGEEIDAMFGGEPPGGGRGRVLLRVFCHAYGDKVVLLLNGYDKGEDPSGRRQQREIRLARKRLEEFRQRQGRQRRGRRG
ncbi:MAG: type II toxin-antitoxin system RelE/ParE family toxin [Actinobacteria bacterium]|nr:type II toxin-antitoxin system RelE/ParE family toxin [Actinomycetota bacterium]